MSLSHQMDIDEIVVSLGIIITTVAVGAGIAEVEVPLGHENLAIAGLIVLGLGFVLLFVDL